MKPPEAATRALAQFIAESRFTGIPQRIRHEAKRALLNFAGCAIGGAREEAVERLLATVAPFSGAREATLAGRGERLDALNAALVNGAAANVLDYDDTHLATVIHPTVPVAAAALALAEHRPATGAQLIHAVILGIETECRIGAAISPGHFAAGWHITATCGVMGAAAAAAKLLALDARRTAWALGIAATQAAGVNEMLGGMSKSFHVGRAAKNGATAALLAARGFTSSERAIEAPRGFAHVLARGARLETITAGLGETWEISGVAYKPFPCAIMLHPVIDGCLQLQAEHRLAPRDIARVDVKCHPLARTPAGYPDPADAHETKFSVFHAAAAALVHGAAGMRQFSDEGARDPEVAALRQRVVPAPDAAIDKIAAHVAITTADGRRLEKQVSHTVGTLERPMSDADLEAKFREIASASRAGCRAWDAIEIAWSLDRLNDAAALARALAPPPAAGTMS